jgi:hypothetical protein
MRAVTSLSILLAVQLGLALLLATRHDPLAGAKLDTPLLPASAVKGTDQLIIESKEAKPVGSTAATGADVTAGTVATAGTNTPDTARVEILRKDGKWVLPGQFDAPADANRVNMLLDRLAALKRGLPVATSEASLRRFKVVDSDFERRVELKAAGAILDTLYLGTSPGLRKSDARTSADHAIYAVDLPAYELPTDPGSWLNADLLREDAVGLTELDVGTSSTDRVQLVKHKGAGGQPTTWTDPALSGNAHIDSAHAEVLAAQLSQMRPDKVLGIAPMPEWQQDHPVLTLELKDENAKTVEWTLSKPSSGDYYVLKSSAQPWFFSVGSAQAKAMIDAGSRDQLIAADKVEAKPPGKS